MISDELKVPGQSFVLVQQAHKDLRCRTHNARAAFRVLGAFPSNDAAVRHFQRGDKRGYFSGLPAVLAPTCADMVIPCREKSPDALEAKARQLCDEHRQATEHAKAKFQARVDAVKATKNPPATDDDAPALAKKPAADEDDAPTLAKNPPATDDDSEVMARDGEVRGQNFCVCSILVDTFTPEQEDLITIYGCFDDVRTATEYMDTLKDVITDRTMYVVNMYSWIYPYLTNTDEFRDSVPRKYREDILNDLLTAGKVKRAKLKQAVQDTQTKQDMDTGLKR